jgi:hypothetical protein
MNVYVVLGWIFTKGLTMKQRDVKGKTVERVRQVRRSTKYGRPVYDIQTIVFTDGTVLILSVAELADDYAVEGTVYKP